MRHTHRVYACTAKDQKLVLHEGRDGEARTEMPSAALPLPSSEPSPMIFKFLMTKPRPPAGAVLTEYMKMPAPPIATMVAGVAGSRLAIVMGWVALP